MSNAFGPVNRVASSPKTGYIYSVSELTDKQQRVFAFIRDTIAARQTPPTRAEIASALGFASANAAQSHLRTLERKGVIELNAGRSRGIRVVAPVEAAAPGVSLAVIGRVAAGAPLLAQGAGPTDADLMNDAATPGDVLTYGMGPRAQRFSPLKQIDAGNVAKLVPAFAASLGGEKQRGQEAQPIVYDGTIYVTGSYSRLFAFDARTGEEKWQYDARLPDAIMPCCDVVNRGAAIYGDKIIFATLDARVVALNRETGKVVWNKQIADYKEGYSATAAPIIVKGMVITGNSGGEFGVVGAVEARDVNTGELIWHRPVIEGHMGTLRGKDNGITGKTNASWQGDLWKTGGGATWLGGTYDPETNLLFFGTGNPAPWNSHLRPGDNLYTSSTIALYIGVNDFLKTSFSVRHLTIYYPFVYTS